MMKYLNLYLPIVLLGMVLTGCNKYLDVTPKGYTLLETVSHYDQWLNAGSLSTDGEYLNYVILSTDCVDKPDIAPASVNADDLAYRWAEQLTTNISVAPPIWTIIYNQIYYFNTVINGIDKASGGTDQQKINLKSEALLGRAYCYLNLVTIYGKMYDSATAATDLSVPFITSENITDNTPPRSTVKEMYDRIIQDLNTAASNSPASNASNRYRGSSAAAYSVLARTYFSVRNYAEAAKMARLALNTEPALALENYNDYNHYNGTEAMEHLPNQGLSKGSIYARNSTFQNILPSLDFLQSFNTRDLRLNFFYQSFANGLWGTTLTSYQFNQRGIVRIRQDGSTETRYQHNSGTSVAEMKMIIAEYEARKGDLTTALALLNELRQNRFTPADYTPVESTDRETVLQKILLERKFEFALTSSLRWVDMRRLDAENRMGTVTRYNGGGAPISTLEPHSPKYTFQIPTRVLVYNPGMPVNPR